jgi:HlyD family secretion protein
MKKIIPILVAVLSLTVYVYFAKIRPARQYDAVVRGSGTVEATTVTISARISGRILTLTPSEGDTLKAGETVATLQCDEPQARLAQAQASLVQARAVRVQAVAGEAQARAQRAPMTTQQRLAQKEFTRAMALFKSESTTQKLVDEAEAAANGTREQVEAAGLAVEVAHNNINVADAQVAVAQKNVDLALTQVNECTLVAPLAGVVLTRNHEPGELVLPGSSLLKVGGLDEVYTWLYIPNQEIGRVKLGEKVLLQADTYPGRNFTGRVARINEEAEFTPKSIQTKEDRTRLVFGVKVSVPNADHALLPGMPVEAQLTGITAEPPVPPVPAMAPMAEPIPVAPAPSK